MPAPSHPGLPVTLRVFDISGGSEGEEIRKLSYKYDSRNSRHRLLKTLYWALNQGHAVEIVREQDDIE